MINNVKKRKNQEGEGEGMCYEIILSNGESWFLNSNNTTHHRYKEIQEWMEEGNTIEETD